MAIGKKYPRIIMASRIVLCVLIIIPFFFWQPFYEHFRSYLTGTILNGVIKSEWQLVIVSILAFAIFLIPLTYRKRAKWIDYGLVGAFFVSLFIEMYGLPLTILFASKYFFVPGALFPPNIIEFNFLGVAIGMDHAMVYGALLITIGMILIIGGWWSLYRQVRLTGFASTGFYAISRHPQYLGFILLILGWFYGWPTILTATFSPILIYKYIRAAQAEEKDMIAQYGESYISCSQERPFLV